MPKYTLQNIPTSVRYLMAVMDEETRPILYKVFQRLQLDLQQWIREMEARNGSDGDGLDWQKNLEAQLSSVRENLSLSSMLINDRDTREACPEADWFSESLKFSEIGDRLNIYSSPIQHLELDDGGAIMVLFRLKPGDNPTELLEANLKLMTNHQHNQWSYISHAADAAKQNDPWQKLVDNMSESLQKGRTPVGVLCQGQAKIKAGDDAQWCVGLLNTGSIPTHISTIIHQTFNMGLNGDLMVNEANCVLHALAENHILAVDPLNPDPEQIRMLDFFSYGAGGASSPEVTPGFLAVSDGVIDLRTHVDPRCIINFLDKQLLCVSTTANNSKIFLKYFLIREKIINKMESHESFEESGFALIEHITSLMQLASILTEKSQHDLVIPEDQKIYYGEITFGTIEGGVRTITRSTLEEDNPGLQWKGAAGQQKAIKWIIDRLQQMVCSNLGSPANRSIEAAHKRLTLEIKKARDAFTHQRKHGAEFTITASANLFFTEQIKNAVASYGAKTVEMEKQIIIYMLNTILRRPQAGIHLNKTFITKIAADPNKISAETVAILDAWTENATMSLDDYMDAYIWNRNGSRFRDVPPSAAWTAVSTLDEDKMETEFISYDYHGQKKVMNPFWKEIGTDLLKEIREQDSSKDAFSGSIWNEWKMQAGHIERIQELKRRAGEIFQSEGPVLECVTDLFRDYLNLEPMSSKDGVKLPDGQYRIYARVGVCSEGVAAPMRDYDPLLYKANNTTMLDQLVSVVIPRDGHHHIEEHRKAEQVGGGSMLVLYPAQKLSEEVTEAAIETLNQNEEVLLEKLLASWRCQQGLPLQQLTVHPPVQTELPVHPISQEQQSEQTFISLSGGNHLQQRINSLCLQIKIIEKKAHQLKKDNHLLAAEAAYTLCSKLTQLVTAISSDVCLTDEKLRHLKQDCHDVVAEARPELAKHRGWKQLLGNLGLAIALLGVFYVAAGIYHKATTGKFLFFDTDSELKLKKLEHAIDEIPEKKLIAIN